jgi:hypothetical protein
MASKFKILSKLMSNIPEAMALKEGIVLENANKALYNKELDPKYLEYLVRKIDQVEPLNKLTSPGNWDEPIKSSKIDISHYPGDSFTEKFKNAVSHRQYREEQLDDAFSKLPHDPNAPDEIIPASQAAMYRGINQNAGVGAKQQRELLDKLDKGYPSRFEELKKKLGLK